MHKPIFLCLLALFFVACSKNEPPAEPAVTQPLTAPTPTVAAVGSVFRDCPECPEMVVLPQGEFTIGSPEEEVQREKSEGPQHMIGIAYALAVGKTEVTYAEWDACFADGGCSHQPEDEGWGRGKRPVVNVNWKDAQEYTQWLSGKTGKPYRLLTEAEWEYAARAGTTTPFNTGTCIKTNQANYDGNDDYNDCGAMTGDYRQKTLEVGSFNPNAFGLFDMHGNVSEWVQDCFEDDYSRAMSDGSAKTVEVCESRVLRGGSWNDSAYSLRLANRNTSTPDARFNNFGFRVAR